MTSSYKSFCLPVVKGMPPYPSSSVVPRPVPVFSGAHEIEMCFYMTFIFVPICGGQELLCRTHSIPEHDEGLFHLGSEHRSSINASLSRWRRSHRGHSCTNSMIISERLWTFSCRTRSHNDSAQAYSVGGDLGMSRRLVLPFKTAALKFILWENELVHNVRQLWLVRKLWNWKIAGNRGATHAQPSGGIKLT